MFLFKILQVPAQIFKDLLKFLQDPVKILKGPAKILKDLLSLVPTSDITIIIISTNIMLLCRLCLSGNVQKHNHKRPYDQHNHKKMIDHFLMIMSMTMTMLLFFIVGTRKS